MDILLIQPSARCSAYPTLMDVAAKEPPIWAGLLASYLLGRGLGVEILDADALDLPAGQIGEVVADLNPTLAVVVAYGHHPSASTQTMPGARLALQAIRDTAPHVKTAILGGHVSALPMTTLKQEAVDFVIEGEGPATLAHLIPAIKANDYWQVPGLWWRGKSGEVLKTAPAPLIMDLDHEMPGSSWHLLPMHRYRAHNWHLLGAASRNGYASIYSTLGCPYKCVSGDTWIASPRALLHPLEAKWRHSEICVEGHTHQFGHLENGLEVVTNGIKPCRRITLRNGLDLHLTAEHLIRCVEEETVVWKPAADIRPGTVLVLQTGQNLQSEEVPLPLPSVAHRGVRRTSLPETLTPDLAWLVGFLLGDGCITTKPTRARLEFAVTEETEFMLRKHWAECFSVPLKVGRLSSTQKCRRAYVDSRWIVEFFQQSLEVVPGAKYRLSLPLRQSSPKVIEAFLEGLWEADGYWPPGRHTYLTTVNKQFAMDLVALGLWAGIRMEIYKGHITGHGHSQAWRIRRCNDICRTKLAGRHCWSSFMPAYPRQRSTARLATHSKGRIYPNRYAGIGTFWAQLKMVEPTHPLLEDRCLYVPVAFVEEEQAIAVYDVAAHPDHQFSANGILVHNCSFCCIQTPFRAGQDAMGMKAGVNSYRRWSPATVRDNLESLLKIHPITNLKIADEMFVLHEGHVLGICDQLIEMGSPFNVWAYARVDTVKPRFLDRLCRAGIRWLALGIEAADSTVRDGQDKSFTDDKIRQTVRACREAGIHVLGNYIFGLPADTKDTMQRTLDLALELRCEWANFYSAVAYPGSALYDQAVDKGWRLPATWAGYAQLSRECVPLPTETLSSEEVLAFRDAAFRTYFTDAGFLGHLRKIFGDGAVAEVEDVVKRPLPRDILGT